VHVRCEGKDELTFAFLGWSFSGATQFCCGVALNEPIFLVSQHGGDPRSLIAKHGTKHCTCLCLKLPSRGGAAVIPARLETCCSSCVCFWQFMVSLRQITAQGVSAFVTVGFLSLLQTECLLTALVLQHLPCMPGSFCGLCECGLVGRFPRCVKTLEKFYLLSSSIQVSLTLSC